MDIQRKRIPVFRREAKEDLAQVEGARKWQLADHNAVDGLYGSVKSAK